jgi:DNA polymerase-1
MAMKSPETYVVLDIETTLDHNTIHGVGLSYVEHGIVSSSTWIDSKEALDAERLSKTIVGHNAIGFDLPVLRNVWGWEPSEETVCLDTLVMSRLARPDRDGGHSLKRLAILAGLQQKDDFSVEDFDGPVTQEMIDYCLQDTRANADVFDFLLRELDGFDERSIMLEMEVARLTREQETNGFCFDFDMASDLYVAHDTRMQEITEELQAVFPPIVTERWSEKTGKRLKDHVETFNPGSRQQVARRLEGKGVKWTKFTEKGNTIVDETTLKEQSHIPEAALVLEYLTLGKRIGMLRSWLDNCKQGRIHGRVNTIGAVTGRMSHSSPNLAQIPSEAQYRRCFTVETGNRLVGIDASGLELRMLAHYMQDDRFTSEILDGDIHTANQQAFGCDTRNQAKTLIYALLYGAGDAKLGNVVGGTAKVGKAMRDSYERSWPAYRKLVAKVTRMAERNEYLPGLDGRRVHVRSAHAALNTLLQSAGAIVMKQALVLASDRLRQMKIPYRLVAQVHDELQIEVREPYAEQVGKVVRNAIRRAGRELDMRCPLDGDYQIGTNWSQTH